MFSLASVGDFRARKGMLRHTRWMRTQKLFLDHLDSLIVPSRALSKFPWGPGRLQRPEKAEAGGVTYGRMRNWHQISSHSWTGRSLSVLFLKLGRHLTLRRSYLGELCTPLASSLHLKQVPRWAPEYGLQLNIQPPPRCPI